METVREQALKAFEAALRTISDVPMERNRDIEVTEYPFIVMIDGGQEPDVMETGIKRVALTVDVEIYVVADKFQELGYEFDYVYGRVIKAALEDNTLGGLVVDVREGPMTDPEDDRSSGRGPTRAAAIAFEIDYWVQPDDPYKLAP